jgi:hypothetical protein
MDDDEVISMRKPINGNEEDGPDHDPFFSLCIDSFTIRCWRADVGVVYSTNPPLAFGPRRNSRVAAVGYPDWPAAYHGGRHGSRSQRTA